ncbi:MAG: alpha/beta hydrolase [Clostridiales Family XIII bacterium]|nr:alpha/beta hydrolase [Clostridiales Family XIII bacterium]
MAKKIGTYRKYLEPGYGEVRPEVAIDAPQALDFSSPEALKASRLKIIIESVADLTDLWRACNCYEKQMKVLTDDTCFKREGTDIPVRVYHPIAEGSGATEKKYPILVFYHGGAWSMNNADVYDFVYRYLAAYQDLIVVAPDYRLAPEYRFPTGIEDAYGALEWTAANAWILGGSKDNISICGDSSGGNFAAAVAQMSRDRGGPTVKGQILIYPATVLNPEGEIKSEELYGTGYFLEYSSKDKMVEFYFDDYADSDTAYASPLCAESLEGLPPALFLSAECDPILDQALMYAARLEDEGVSVKYHLYEGMIHAYINRPYHETIDSLDEIGKFVRAHG